MATTARAPRKAKAPDGGQETRDGKCRCGCGEDKGKGQFRPGHDARYLSNLRKDYEAGTLPRDRAQAAAEAVSPAMGRKLARSLELAAARVAARESAQASK